MRFGCDMFLFPFPESFPLPSDSSTPAAALQLSHPPSVSSVCLFSLDQRSGIRHVNFFFSLPASSDRLTDSPLLTRQSSPGRLSEVFVCLCLTPLVSFASFEKDSINRASMFDVGRHVAPRAMQLGRVHPHPDFTHRSRNWAQLKMIFKK